MDQGTRCLEHQMQEYAHLHFDSFQLFTVVAVRKVDDFPSMDAV